MKHFFSLTIFFCLMLIFSCTKKVEAPVFDMEKLRKEGETILNDIPGWHVKLEVHRYIQEDRHFDDDEEKMAKQMVYYTFLDKNEMGFSIEEMQFDDELRAQMVFARLQQKSKGGDETPGLTYTNDFLLKKSTSIFWLNTPCSFSWLNHNLLVKAFKRSFYTGIGHDTIQCRCGFECD